MRADGVTVEDTNNYYPNIITTDFIKISPADKAILYSSKSYSTGNGFHIYYFNENKTSLGRRTIYELQTDVPLNIVDYAIIQHRVYNFSYIKLAYTITNKIRLFIYKYNNLLYPNMQNILNYGKQDILVDQFKAENYVPGYYCPLPTAEKDNRITAYKSNNIEDCVGPLWVHCTNSMWIVPTKPTYVLYPDQIAVIKAESPVYIYGFIGNTFIAASDLSDDNQTATNFALRQNENNEIIVKNKYSGILKVYVSISIEFALYHNMNNVRKSALLSKEFYNYYTQNKELIIPENNKHTISVYEILNNALESDRGTFNESFFITNKLIRNYARVVTDIYITTNTSRTCKIAIGLHDQRDWFVASDTYNITLSAGKNYIDVRSMNIIIPAGYQLAYEIAEGDEYLDFKEYDPSTFKTERFNSLSSINITDTRSNIIPLFEFDAEPIYYMNGNQTVHESTNQQQFYYTPNGVAYRLQLDNNANILKTRVTPLKYCAIGNSITQHGIKQDIGWYVNTRSMAASKDEYDYPHRLSTYFQSKDANYVGHTQHNFSNWEVATERAAQLYKLDDLISDNPDLITIQLGENASDTTTLQQDYIDLIKYIRNKCPSAYIVMIGDCFNSAIKDSMKKNACKATGVPFVDLSAYSSQASFKSYIGATIYKNDGSTFEVTNSGVANHPGDNGFKIIAEEVLKVIYNDNTISL